MEPTHRKAPRTSYRNKKYTGHKSNHNFRYTGGTENILARGKLTRYGEATDRDRGKSLSRKCKTTNLEDPLRLFVLHGVFILPNYRYDGE